MPGNAPVVWEQRQGELLALATKAGQALMERFDGGELQSLETDYLYVHISGNFHGQRLTLYLDDVRYLFTLQETIRVAEAKAAGSPELAAEIEAARGVVVRVLEVINERDAAETDQRLSVGDLQEMRRRVAEAIVRLQASLR